MGNTVLLGLDATVCLYPWAGSADHIGVGVNRTTIFGFYPLNSGARALTGTPGEVKRDEETAEAGITIKTSPEDSANIVVGNLLVVFER